MKPLKLIFTSASLATAILGLIFYPEIKESFTHAEKNSQKQEMDLVEASQLLDLGRTYEAASLIKKYKNEISNGTANGTKWFELLVRASEDLPDTEQLLHIFHYNPQALQGHEKGALRVANALTAEGDWKNYTALRSLFKGHEKYASKWFILDADNLIIQGNNAEAITSLKSRYFEGSEDTDRLLRLALLHSNEHPKLAWDYLDQAMRKDPENNDIRLYRARLLETAGKKELAQSEYAAAGRPKDNSEFIQNELVDFYLRQHNYAKATLAVEKQLGPSLKESLGLKALFLSRVIEPIPFDFRDVMEKSATRGGIQHNFIKYVANLPEGQFWNGDTFSAVPQSQSLLATEQSTLWLRVLENLRSNREADALTLLQNNSFQNQLWDNELSVALQRVLSYRLKGTLTLTTDQFSEPTNSKKSSLPRFFDELNLYARNESNAHNGPSEAWIELVKGPEAFSSVFLARGWNEAAINLMTTQIYPDNTPEWVTPAMTLALKNNRGMKEALVFAKLQRQIAPLRLVHADLMLEKGDLKDAEEELFSLTTLDNSSGRRAARQLAVIMYQKKDYAGAKVALSHQPKVANSLKGQELQARIALAEGNDEDATKFYTAIESSSIEAKSFLAKKAFEEKNYRRAYLLTEELLKTNPNSEVLKSNLNKLLQELEPS